MSGRQGGELSATEVNQYIQLLGDHVAKMRNYNSWLQEQLEESAEEDRRLAVWRRRGEIPEPGYLLSTINDSIYNNDDPQDRAFLDDVQEQRRLDAKLRRELGGTPQQG
eukprot:Hpha_TRINITY_DN4183_c0_g2::TRINITY_DN4183_c0_g2_i1::g.194756::m.194756